MCGNTWKQLTKIARGITNSGTNFVNDALGADGVDGAGLDERETTVAVAGTKGISDGVSYHCRRVSSLFVIAGSGQSRADTGVDGGAVSNEAFLSGVVDW